MGFVNFTCCATVEEKSNEPNNETTSEKAIPLVYAYPTLAQPNNSPRSTTTFHAN